MPVQFKFASDLGRQRRAEIVDALSEAGFSSQPLFPAQKRANLSAIHTIPESGEPDLAAVRRILASFGDAIEYVEAAPDRTLKD